MTLFAKIILKIIENNKLKKNALLVLKNRHKYFIIMTYYTMLKEISNEITRRQNPKRR